MNCTMRIAWSIVNLTPSGETRRVDVVTLFGRPERGVWNAAVLEGDCCTGDAWKWGRLDDLVLPADMTFLQYTARSGS